MSTQMEGLKVGTTEEFQGQVSIQGTDQPSTWGVIMSLQERRVIIISTVRSNPAHALGDIRQRLGFVGDAQRFNGA